MRHVARALLAFVLVFLAPLAGHALWWQTRDDLAPSRASADWSSARLLPPPAAAPEASVRIYAARTGRWRGIFAHHSWIVVKEAGARRYTRFDKVGWGSPVRTDGWPADGRWFGHPPEVILALDGAEAERGHPEDPGRRAGLPLPDLRRLPRLAGPELQHLRRPRARSGAGARRRPAADGDRQGLAAARPLARLDAEPHRRARLPRRLRRHHASAGSRASRSTC